MMMGSGREWGKQESAGLILIFTFILVWLEAEVAVDNFVVVIAFVLLFSRSYS